MGQREGILEVLLSGWRLLYIGDLIHLVAAIVNLFQVDSMIWPMFHARFPALDLPGWCISVDKVIGFFSELPPRYVSEYLLWTSDYFVNWRVVLKVLGSTSGLTTWIIWLRLVEIISTVNISYGTYVVQRDITLGLSTALRRCQIRLSDTV